MLAAIITDRDFLLPLSSEKLALAHSRNGDSKPGNYYVGSQNKGRDPAEFLKKFLGNIDESNPPDISSVLAIN